ncbi:MAG TPA: glycosyl hydrolase [Solirubrobacterales bacterium]|nr:glycosyl hydrolase [Solirubrobacterales bacterium]
MAQSSSRRLAARVVWLAAVIFLLSAGLALAKSGSGHSGGRKQVKLANARALRTFTVSPSGAKPAPAAKGAAAAGAAPAVGVAPAVEVAPAPKPAPQPLYWGATIGSHLTGTQAPWDMNAVSKFEQGAGKSASAVQFFQPFAYCNPGCSFYRFPTTPMNSIRSHGSIPVLSWSSQSIPWSLNEPDFQLGDVIEGRYDNFIRDFAEEARDWGHPFFLRFNWEMNGGWFPWSEQANGNSPGQYVAAWRHVHDVFAAVGATNATWVWCPFVEGGDAARLSSLYPGDAYVDWTGLDGYNWGTNPAGPNGWRSFDQLFAASYNAIAGSVAPTKPMMIAEVGSSEIGGDKAAWIRDALARIPADYPQVRAMLWFDKFDDGMDWPIETSSAATFAFAEGVSQSVYQGAGYGQLSGGPIQPPS